MTKQQGNIIRAILDQTLESGEALQQGRAVPIYIEGLLAYINANAAAGGPSLSDYGVVVVAANGTGDYTKLSTAYSNAVSGDTILYFSGDIETEAFNIGSDGGVAKPVSVIGMGFRPVVTLTGSARIELTQSNLYNLTIQAEATTAVYCRNTPSFAVSPYVIENCTIISTGGYGLGFADDIHHVTVRNTHVTGSTNGLLVSAQDNSDYYFYNVLCDVSGETGSGFLFSGTSASAALFAQNCRFVGGSVSASNGINLAQLPGGTFELYNCWAEGVTLALSCATYANAQLYGCHGKGGWDPDLSFDAGNDSNTES